MNNRAQATTELAVFGSLILICLAVLVSYGQSLQEQQILQQQAFRKALKKAYDENAFASYNIIKNPRTVNLFGGYGEGSRGGASSGASVAWCLGDPAEKNYYEINEDEIEVPTGTKIIDVETRASTTYTARETKFEDPTAATTTKQARLTDTLTTTLKADGGSDITITQGLGADGCYRQSTVGQEVSKDKEWVTPH
ncbi:MAG: hypothetical protein PHQ43_14090 [Dehalococcoidales bacterium]|nr:hypothetical protein [Dehalococcoidales bacterium]